VSPFGDDRYTPDVSPDAPRAATAAAETIAQQLLKRHHVSTLPVLVDALVEAESLTLLRIEDGKGPDGELRAKARLIVVNTSHRSTTRIRFTTAHELGHWCLGHHKAAAGDALLNALVDQRLLDDLDPLRSGQELAEIEANAFASALLMPADLVRRVHREKTFDANIAARRFEVSPEAFFYRLQRLRLL
jgi:Zn-dependent peptidase ImmA (M78 family)